MKIVNGIQDTGHQRFQIASDTGINIEITLRFLPTTNNWIAGIVYGDFEVSGLRLYNAFNVLHQYNKIIPFGLYVRVEDGGEPFLLNDFTSKRVTLGILTKDEVSRVANIYETPL